MSTFSEDYKVNTYDFMEPDVAIEGRLVVPGCDSIWCFADAIDELGKKATEGIIGVIPLEQGFSRSKNEYAELTILERLIEKTNLRGVLTFGRGSVNGDQTSGQLTHFDVIKYEYDLPVCFAKRPRAFRGEAQESEWRRMNGLRALQGKKGSIALSTNAKRVTLTTLG